MCKSAPLRDITAEASCRAKRECPDTYMMARLSIYNLLSLTPTDFGHHAAGSEFSRVRQVTAGSLLSAQTGDLHRTDFATVSGSDRAEGHGTDIANLIFGVDPLRECHRICPG